MNFTCKKNNNVVNTRHYSRQMLQFLWFKSLVCLYHDTHELYWIPAIDIDITLLILFHIITVQVVFLFVF